MIGFAQSARLCPATIIKACSFQILPALPLGLSRENQPRVSVCADSATGAKSFSFPVASLGAF